MDLTCASWRKSRAAAKRRQCVEVARILSRVVAVRDSKDQAGPALIFTPAEWEAFTAQVRDGEFNLP